MDSLVVVLDTLENWDFINLKSMEKYGFTTNDNLFQSNEVKIVHLYRFEGESNPDDSSIMYA
jgi:hypothetical protein